MGTSASKLYEVQEDGFSLDLSEAPAESKPEPHEKLSVASEVVPEDASLNNEQEEKNEFLSSEACEVEIASPACREISENGLHDNKYAVEANLDEHGSNLEEQSGDQTRENFTAFEIPFYDTLTAKRNIVTPLYSPPPIYAQISYLHVDNAAYEPTFPPARMDEGTQTPETCSLAATSIRSQSRQTGFQVRIKRPTVKKTLCQKYPHIYGKVRQNLLPIINYESPSTRPTTYLVESRESNYSRKALSTSERKMYTPINSLWKTEHLGGGTWLHYQDTETDHNSHRPQASRQNQIAEKPLARRLKPIEPTRLPIINPAAGDQNFLKKHHPINTKTTPPTMLPPLSNVGRKSEPTQARGTTGPVYRGRGHMLTSGIPLASLYTRSRPMPPNPPKRGQCKQGEDGIGRMRPCEFEQVEDGAKMEREDIVFRQSRGEASTADFCRKHFSHDEIINRKRKF